MTEKLKGPFLPEVKKMLEIRVAEKAFTGRNILQISDELNITRRQVRKMLGSPTVEKIIKQATKNVMLAASGTIKNKIAAQANIATDALMVKVKEGNVKALEVYFKIVGVLNREDDSKDTTSAPITIIMPGSTINQEKVIEVKSEAKDDTKGS